MKNKSYNEIDPFLVALKIAAIYLFISLIGTYFSNKILLNIYKYDFDLYVHFQNLRSYTFVIFAFFIILFLVYQNLNRIKTYEETIKSNLKEIYHKEIDLYQAEYRINNQKHLIDNIVRSASLLIMSLDENLNIKNINGNLELFTSLDKNEILGKEINILFESSIDKEDVLIGNIKNMELKILSNSNEDKYALANISLKNNNKKNKLEYTAVLIDITQKKLLEKQIHYLDYYDALTDLPNRTFLELKYKNLKSKNSYKDKPFAFLYVDIDDFKHINESLCHHAGDVFLVYMSKLLKSSISKKDILSRITQDEFAIILTDVKSKEDIEKVISKIYKKIEIPWKFNKVEYNVTATIGVTIAPYDGDEFDILLKNAHLTSEYLKSKDRGNYQYYSKKLEAIVLDSLNIINEIKKSIANDEFVLHYQTFMNLNTNEVIGVESLIRWIHPEKGMISPGEFIPIIEKTVLAYDLMNFVVEKALNQKRQWNLSGVNVPKISINISSKSFSKVNFNLFMENSIKKYGLKNSEIILELTESGFTDNIKTIEENINYLRNIGIKIAMDDFGTGYSTLSRLKTIPIDYLKLDKSFIDNMTKNSEEEAMVKSVISLANTFGLIVVAEGIETEEQFNLLKEMNCDLGQGYYISKPVCSENLNSSLVKYK